MEVKPWPAMWREVEALREAQIQFGVKVWTRPPFAGDARIIYAEDHAQIDRAIVALNAKVRQLCGAAWAMGTAKTATVMALQDALDDPGFGADAVEALLKSEHFNRESSDA